MDYICRYGAGYVVLFFKRKKRGGEPFWLIGFASAEPASSLSLFQISGFILKLNLWQKLLYYVMFQNFASYIGQFF